LAAKETVNFKGLADALGTDGVGGAKVSGSYFSGVKLGTNTSETGELYFKIDLQTSGEESKIYVYKDAQMRDEDLVAQSDVFDATAGDGKNISIFAKRIGDTGLDTGLCGAINLGKLDPTKEVYKSGLLSEGASIKFENLGVRLSATEYGADQYVKINQTQGALFTRYDLNNNAHVLDTGLSGTEWTNYGSNAIMSFNGQRIELQGTKWTLTNLDATVNIAFKEGEVGNTTIVSAGYTDGPLSTKAGVYGDTNNQEVNALHSTTEIIKNFTGGMQLQIGEGSGDQNRTVYSMKDMTSTSLGKMKFHDFFGNDFKTDQYLSVSDMMSGGKASLAVDSVKAMAVGQSGD
jgi:hypothetical protein